MPTKAEFDALCRLTNEWKTNYKGSGVNGYLFTDDNSNSIFLPAAGYGGGTDLNDAGDGGNYWSSSLYTNYPQRAYYLAFGDDSGDEYAYSYYEVRCFGQSVRALSE